MRYPRKPGNPKSTAQPKHRHAAPTSWQRRTRYLQLLAIPVAFSLLTVSSPANAAPLTTVDADQTVSSPTWDAITRDSQAVAVATTVTPQQVSSISSDIVAEAGSPHAAAARAAGVTLTPTDIIAYAETFTGTPYVYGGSTPSGFDCSGFTAYIWAHYGVTLPHSASAQAAAGTTVDESAAQPGDIVYMPGHVGLWVSPGIMIDSPTEGRSVTVRSIYTSSYRIIHVN